MDRKGARLDGEMHSINLFSDAYTRQVEALTQKSPNRAIHSVNPHRSHVFEKGKQILMGKPLVIKRVT
jgi:hypothetical protein